jgi:hypothetical protein
MSTTFRLEGLAELRQALQRLPETMLPQVTDIVVNLANDMAREQTEAYPIRQTNLEPGPRRKTPFYPPGNLHNHVKVALTANRFGVAALVSSTSPHASIYYKGTSPRQTRTGANRGFMPAGPDAARFIPRAIRTRHKMFTALMALVQDYGFDVTGP